MSIDMKLDKATWLVVDKPEQREYQIWKAAAWLNTDNGYITKYRCGGLNEKYKSKEELIKQSSIEGNILREELHIE